MSMTLAALPSGQVSSSSAGIWLHAPWEILWSKKTYEWEFTCGKITLVQYIIVYPDISPTILSIRFHQWMTFPVPGWNSRVAGFIELDDGKIYRKALYLMVKTMVSCRFSLKPIH